MLNDNSWEAAIYAELLEKGDLGYVLGIKIWDVGEGNEQFSMRGKNTG